MLSKPKHLDLAAPLYADHRWEYFPPPYRPLLLDEEPEYEDEIASPAEGEHPIWHLIGVFNFPGPELRLKYKLIVRTKRPWLPYARNARELAVTSGLLPPHITDALTAKAQVTSLKDALNKMKTAMMELEKALNEREET